MVEEVGDLLVEADVVQLPVVAVVAQGTHLDVLALQLGKKHLKKSDYDWQGNAGFTSSQVSMAMVLEFMVITPYMKTRTPTTAAGSSHPV